MSKVQTATIFLFGWVLALGQETNVTPIEVEETRFIRHVEVGRRAQLQTANVTYRHTDGSEVTLLSAIHIGDAAYYKKLSTAFEAFDALLYELVLPDDGVPPGERLAMSGIRSSQQMARTLLGLSFQMDGIDYSAKNFIHADMTMKNFSEAQHEEGETWFRLYLKTLKMERKRQATDGGKNLDIASLFSSRDRVMSLKLMMSSQLANTDVAADLFDGESVIISQRNAVALEVFDEQRKAGQKKIGIFYGAAHMPEFETELLKRGYEHSATVWLSAWNMYRP